MCWIIDVCFVIIIVGEGSFVWMSQHCNISELVKEEVQTIAERKE